MKIFFSRLRGVLLLCILPLLISCTPGFLYNNLDWITLWYVDDYVSLDSAQKKAYTLKFNEIQQWHREYELENYRQLFMAINRQVDSEHLTEADINRAVSSHHQAARTLWRKLVIKTFPHLHELTGTLSDRQKQELIHNLSEKNKSHFKKKQSYSSEEWQEEKVARLKKNLSRWLGSLTKEQVQMVISWAGELHRVDRLHYEYRQQWLHELQQALALPLDKSSQQLEQLLANREDSMPSDYRQLLEANRQLTEQLIARLLITRTTSQNKNLADEVDDWLKAINKEIES